MARCVVFQGGRWVALEHAACFTQGKDGFVIGGGHDPAALFRLLVVPLAEPFVATYVLHGPRTGARAGRYRSPNLSLGEMRLFLEKYSGFLAGDGRHELIGESPAESAVVRWDRYDRLFASGPLDHFSEILETLEFVSGSLSVPVANRFVEDPAHDLEEQDLLGAMDWQWSELTPEDQISY